MTEIYTLMSKLGYRIIQDTDRMDVYGGNTDEYKDVFIRMQYEDSCFYFFLINRGKEIPKGYEEDFNMAFIKMYILCRSIYDPSPDQLPCLEIRAAVKREDYTAAEELIRQEADDEFFSTSEVVYNKISLIMERDKGTAVFQGKTIEKSMSPGRAYIVLFNCARWLKRFKEIYRELTVKTGLTPDYDTLSYIYIFEELREN